MKLSCPTCRRKFRSEDSQCRRCGTDLTLIKNFLSHGRWLLIQAKTSLKAETPRAIKLYREVLKLDPENCEAKKGLALAALLQGDFKHALERYE